MPAHQRKRRFLFTDGFSLPEVLIASVILSIVILAVTKIFSGGTRSLFEARQATQAASFAQMIDARVRGMPFNDVFSYDSSTPTPVYVASAALVAAFPANNYLVPFTLSRASYTLSMLQTEMAAKGFTRFTINVQFVRRDSSDQNNDELVEDYVGFSDANTDGCDDVDTSVCFKDCTNDGKYYGVCPNGKPEVPDTGLKMVTISVYKRSNLMAVKHGTLLTKSGLTGEETPTSESPLKLNVFTPNKTYYLFQARPDLVDNLEMPSLFTYGAGYYGTSALRIDTYPVTLTIENGATAIMPGMPSYMLFTGWTEPGATIELYAKPTTWVPPASGPGAAVDTGLAQPNGTFDIQATNDMLSAALMARGQWNIWSRAHNGYYYSPFDKRPTQNANDQPPYVSTKGPVGNIKTLSPFIFGVPYDDSGGYQSGWNSVSQCTFKITDLSDLAVSTIVPKGAWSCSRCSVSNPTTYVTWYWGNWVSEYFNLSGEWASRWTGPDGSANFVLHRNTGLNPEWAPGKTYEVREDLGDLHMYKSSTVWTFTTPTQAELDADVTPPIINLPLAAGGINAFYDPTHVTTFTYIYAGTPVNINFLWIRMSDPESGINLKTYKMEICDQDLNPGSCFNFFSTSSIGGRWGDNFNLFTNTLTGQPTKQFASAQAAPYRIRVSVKNWAGLTAVIDDWYIFVR